MKGTVEAETADSPPAASTRRYGASPEDLAWLGPIAGAALLVAAFVWVAPVLAPHFPQQRGEVFSLWQGTILPEQRADVRAMLALGTPFVIAAVVLALGTRRPS